MDTRTASSGLGAWAIALSLVGCGSLVTRDVARSGGEAGGAPSPTAWSDLPAAPALDCDAQWSMTADAVGEASGAEDPLELARPYLGGGRRAVIGRPAPQPGMDDEEQQARRVVSIIEGDRVIGELSVVDSGTGWTIGSVGGCDGFGPTGDR